MMKFLCVATVFLGFASTAFAIRCYVCSSLVQSDCNDPFEAGHTYATDCSAIKFVVGQATGCLKLDEEDAGIAHTTRMCYYGDVSKSKDNCKQSKEFASDYIKQLYCDVCTTDLCNSSTTTGIFAATVMCLVALVRVMS